MRKGSEWVRDIGEWLWAERDLEIRERWENGRENVGCGIPEWEGGRDGGRGGRERMLR